MLARWVERKRYIFPCFTLANSDNVMMFLGQRDEALLGDYGWPATFEKRNLRSLWGLGRKI